MKRMILPVLLLFALLLFAACAPEEAPLAEDDPIEQNGGTEADDPEADDPQQGDTNAQQPIADAVDGAEAARVVAEAVQRLNAGEPDADKAADLRALLFEYLPHIDWRAYGELGGEYDEPRMDLLVWLAEEEISEEQEIKALLTLADDTDGAYSDIYATAITNTFLLGPRQFVTLMAEEEEAIQKTLGLFIAYGAWQREEQVGAALQQLMAEDMDAHELAALQQIAAGMARMSS